MTGLCNTRRATVAGIALGLACAMDARADAGPLPVVMDESELREARAGFSVGGLEITLGADLRTYLDGQLALRTVVQWQGEQATSERWVSPELTPAAALATGGVFSGGQLSFHVNDDDAFIAPGGQTALVQPDDGRLQNIVLNAASDVAIRQEADIAIGVAGYQSFATAILPDILIGGLNDALTFSAAGAAGP